MERTMIVKVVVIGDSTTGKTSIVHRYVKDVFLDQVRPTIGVEFFNKDVTVQTPNPAPPTSQYSYTPSYSPHFTNIMLYTFISS